MTTEVRAHITGTIIRVEANEGDSVVEGQAVVIIESMKMEMPVESPIAGRVRAVRVRVGQSVDEGTVVAELA